MQIEVVMTILAVLSGLLVQLRLWHAAYSNRKLFEKWTEQGRPDEVFDRYSRFVASAKSGKWSHPEKIESSHLQLIRDVDPACFTPPAS